MPNVNVVILIGHLTRDPQTKVLPSNTTICEFGLATSRKFKSQGGEQREETCFVDLVAFGNQADTIAKYCKRGKALYVQGRLKYDSWEDKNGGGKRSKVTVVVENFQFIGPREQGEGSGEEKYPDRPSVKNWDGAKMPERRAAQAGEPFGDSVEFKEADIPF